MIFRVIYLLVMLNMLYQMCILIKKLGECIYKRMIMKEKNLKKIVDKNSWVCILDGGKEISNHFIKEFAKRRINILIIGENVDDIKKYIINKYPIILCETLQIKYNDCYNKGYYNKIKIFLKEKKIRIYVNYIERILIQKPYETISKRDIKDMLKISYIRSVLMKIIINKCKRDKDRNIIVDIHSMVNHSNYTFNISNEISIPYKSIKTSIDAYNYYNILGIYNEYKKLKNIDFLIIKKGCVTTEKNNFFKKKIFSEKSEIFVKECMRYIGNVTGVHSVSYMMDINTILVNMLPYYKDRIMNGIGEIYLREIREN